MKKKIGGTTLGYQLTPGDAIITGGQAARETRKLRRSAGRSGPAQMPLLTVNRKNQPLLSRSIGFT